jgi:hypothetical protein
VTEQQPPEWAIEQAKFCMHRSYDAIEHAIAFALAAERERSLRIIEECRAQPDIGRDWQSVLRDAEAQIQSSR